MHRPSIVWFGIVLVVAVGSSALAAETDSPKDAASMKALLKKKLPEGTSLQKARQYMEGAGFKSSLMRKGSFSEDGVVREGIDYLYCDRSEKVSLFVIRRWQVAIVLKGESVSEILVSVGLIGL